MPLDVKHFIIISFWIMIFFLFSFHLFITILFWVKVSLHGSGWPRTHCIEEAGLNFETSASRDMSLYLLLGPVPTFDSDTVWRIKILQKEVVSSASTRGNFSEEMGDIGSF